MRKLFLLPMFLIFFSLVVFGVPNELVCENDLDCDDGNTYTTDSCDLNYLCVYVPADYDNDGTPDLFDGCPEYPGHLDNGGCPYFCFNILESRSGVCSNNGQCIANNVCECNTGFSGNECSSVSCTSSSEICDGIDNDCDGKIDEGLAQPSTCGIGACRRSIFQSCSDGSWNGVCTPFSSSEEICDDIDNDCDGLVDEDGVCPIDCVVSLWSPWSTCSSECDGGVMNRTREVLIDTDFGGLSCPVLFEESTCNEQICGPVDCIVSSWSPWSTCSAECDGGVMNRTRDILVDSSLGGLSCSVLFEDSECNTHNCSSDLDGDGFENSVDCAPDNAQINPGAIEIPGNTVDENCDSVIICNPEGSFRNYGTFTRCVFDESLILLNEGVITSGERSVIIRSGRNNYMASVTVTMLGRRRR